MATESVDEILDKLVDYVGAGVGNMTRKKAKAALDAYITRECARKVLEGRLAELEWVGSIRNNHHGVYLQQGNNDVDDRLAELRAALKEVGGGE